MSPAFCTAPHGVENIDFSAETWCSEDVPEIRMGQDVIHSTPIDPNNPLTNSTVKHDTNVASTFNNAACQPGQYAVNASARIVPARWVHRDRIAPRNQCDRHLLRQ